jgi:hypothetical protein
MKNTGGNGGGYTICGLLEKRALKNCNSQITNPKKQINSNNSNSKNQTVLMSYSFIIVV